MTTDRQAEIKRLYDETGNQREVARILGIHRRRVWEVLEKFKERDAAVGPAVQKLESLGYDLTRDDRTPEEAWHAGADHFEQAASKVLQSRWQTIQRPRGAFVIFHSTDEHLDDDKTPLRLIEADIKAAHDMGSVMCHGGDALNNWPMAGKLAKQWAHQQCTAPDALLRLKHFISIFKPDAWCDGNHEEMNPYLDAIIADALPAHTLRDYWTVRFVVQAEGGRPVRAIMSHKFQKGSSWFHKAHGHIREMLEGEEADVLIDGHVHSDGVLDHTLPERGHAALCVASGGYKVLDKYGARISRGGSIPKIRGRAHWIVCDPYADFDENLATAFKSPRQAEVMLNGLQNLRAA
jgi:UDP-2,3-diacylglucosamine pyrophosphatase LpxH